MVEMELNEKTWFTVRETPGVGDFVGAHGTPTKMTEAEVNQMLGQQEQRPTAESRPRSGSTSSAATASRSRTARSRTSRGPSRKSSRPAAWSRSCSSSSTGRRRSTSNTGRWNGFRPSGETCSGACSGGASPDSNRPGLGSRARVTRLRDEESDDGEGDDGEGEAPVPRRPGDPRPAGRPGAGPARREHRSVRDAVQRTDQGDEGDDHPRRDHDLLRPVVRVHHQEPARRRAPEADRRDRLGLGRAAQDQGRHRHRRAGPKIAETKFNDLNARDIEHACRIIAGTARSMGIEIKG